MKLRNLEWTEALLKLVLPMLQWRPLWPHGQEAVANRPNAMESWSIFLSAITCPSTTEFRNNMKQLLPHNSKTGPWKMSCWSPKWSCSTSMICFSLVLTSNLIVPLKWQIPSWKGTKHSFLHIQGLFYGFQYFTTSISGHLSRPNVCDAIGFRSIDPSFSPLVQSTEATLSYWI